MMEEDVWKSEVYWMTLGMSLSLSVLIHPWTLISSYEKRLITSEGLSLSSKSPFLRSPF